MLRDVCSFFLWNMYFLLVLGLYSKGILNELKKVLRRRGMRSRCSFHFRYVTNKIVFTLRVNMPQATVVTLFVILRLSLVG